MKIGGAVFDSCVVFITSCLLRKTSRGEDLSDLLLTPFFRARHRPTLPVRARPAQLGTAVYLDSDGLFLPREHRRPFKGFKRSQCVKPAWSLKLIGAWQFFLATHRWPELNTWHCEGVGCARARTPAKHLRGNYSRIQEPAQTAQACKVNRTESQGGYRRRETKTNCSRVGVIPRSRRVGRCKGLKRDRPVPVPFCCVAADFRLPLRH